ncbi:MAG: SDR family oxidoreductase [bacterium]|nr:SDR family oxidoreductase [bacterium]
MNETEHDPKLPRAMICGISGFLGTNLAIGLKDRFRLSGSFCHSSLPDSLTATLGKSQLYQVDLTDRQAVKEVIAAAKPEVIFHTAALSQPDRCEGAPDLAWQVNVEGTENLLACLDPSVRFIFVSTDLVFDGRKGWYREDDQVNPLNVYAKTKLEAEKRVRAWAGNYVIVRISLLYGLRYGSRVDNSFLGWLSRSLKAGQPVYLFTDQYRTCLLVQDAVEVLFRLSRQSCTGTFHLGGAERISRYEFGQKFARIFGYSSDLIRPVLMSDLPCLAARAADCSLVSEKIIQATGFAPADVDSGLRVCLKNQAKESTG